MRKLHGPPAKALIYLRKTLQKTGPPSRLFGQSARSAGIDVVLDRGRFRARFTSDMVGICTGTNQPSSAPAPFAAVAIWLPYLNFLRRCLSWFFPVRFLSSSLNSTSECLPFSRFISRGSMLWRRKHPDSYIHGLTLRCGQSVSSVASLQ